MFFYPAKLIWFVLQPSAALLLILLAGIVAIGFGKARGGSRLVLFATAGLLVAGFLPLGPALMLPLEDRIPRGTPEGPVTGIVVLGGGLDQRLTVARGVAALTGSAGRMTEAVALARRYPEAKLVFTGGSADLIPDGLTEGAAARSFFHEMGVDDARVVIEEKSRDTAENARFTKALVGPKPGEQWILVTSAWHMPRAFGVFRAAGWSVLPWPVDFATRDSRDLLYPMPSPSAGLALVDLAMKEWVGLVAYRLAGRTDALFPGP
jgi:uncharacterized SAM-binding protein YcdF (DUF218 family)